MQSIRCIIRLEHERREFFTICCLLVTIGAVSWADGADFYSAWSNLMKNFADPNTGLTVFPTLLIPMGGKYEGMGTAYTAMAADGGFMESNPAASSRLARTELSFFHHAWIADSNLEGIIYTMRFNDLGIGLGGKFLYVPFTAYNEWGVAGAQDYISETVATANVSYDFFFRLLLQRHLGGREPEDGLPQHPGGLRGQPVIHGGDG